jgi:capsular polysaccharide transport system ATP-binding protein
VRVNIAHVARLYGADPDEIVSFVSRIRHFRPTLNKKFSEVPGPLRHDLGVLVASLIPFDVYLLPSEISKLRISPAFKSIASAILQQRARTSGMIVQTQDPKFVRKECDMVILLHRGKLLLYDDVEKALSRKRVIRTRLSS